MWNESYIISFNCSSSSKILICFYRRSSFRVDSLRRSAYLFAEQKRVANWEWLGTKRLHGNTISSLRTDRKRKREREMIKAANGKRSISFQAMARTPHPSIHLVRSFFVYGESTHTQNELATFLVCHHICYCYTQTRINTKSRFPLPAAAAAAVSQSSNSRGHLDSIHSAFVQSISDWSSELSVCVRVLKPNSGQSDFDSDRVSLISRRIFLCQKKIGLETSENRVHRSWRCVRKQLKLTGVCK